MNLMSDLVPQAPGAKIKVVGVGGGGNNAVNTMIRSQLDGVEFISINTDIQALRSSLAQVKIQVGKELTKGLGAGADPDIGRDAALEDRHEIQEALSDADMVFVTAGMGGGTGTGGASIVAQIARELGALTVAVVTKPFDFEGKRRRRHSELGMARLKENVDTLITIPNQRLLQVATPNTTMLDAFKMADEVLLNAVKGISDIINVPGTINVDFADVRTVMSSMGMALMGIGIKSGENRAMEAARQAISSPLLEDIDIEGATGILINITSGPNITLMEVNEACSIIQEAAHEDANIIFGAVIDEKMGDEIRVTVIATGFEQQEEKEIEYKNFATSSSTLFQGLNSQRKKAVANPPLATPVVTEIKTIATTITSPVVENIEKPEIEELTLWTMSSTEEKIEDDLSFESLLNVTVDPIQEPSKESFIEERTILGATAEKEEFFPLNKDTIEKIDQQLDDALALAEKIGSISIHETPHFEGELKTTTSEEDLDELDVPAFLRRGIKDLPLE